MNTSAEAARDSLLKTDIGEVVNIGRVKIPRMPTLGFDHEIPLLSFVVIKDNEEETYAATCIHLQIGGYGDTAKDAVSDMIDNIWHFLCGNFEDESRIDEAWNNILGMLVSNPRSNVLWDAYHAMQVKLARRGIATDPYALLYNKIKSLNEKVRELEATVKEKEAIISKLKEDEYLVVEFERAA